MPNIFQNANGVWLQRAEQLSDSPFEDLPCPPVAPQAAAMTCTTSGF